MLRWIVGIFLVLSIGACTNAVDPNETPVALGNFNLKHNIAVAPKAVKGPLSREVTKEELEEAMKQAVADRFGRYSGTKDYHFGVSIEGYVLAAPGIPLVLAPKSILIINLTVWDDAAGVKLNETPHQITVLETFGKAPIIGTGFTMNKAEQLENLSQNAAKAIERFLVKQNEEQGWFVETATAEVESE